MLELKQITVKEYFDLEDKTEYDFVMKFAFRFTEPIDEYEIGDIMELPFGLVKDFQYDLEHEINMNKLIDYALKVTKRKTFSNEPIDKFCRFINYLLEGIKSIIETERIALAYEPTGKEETANIDRFNELGIYLQIRMLTGGDVTKVEVVRNLPYSLCFTEMYAAKQLKEYQDEINKLSQNK